MDMLLSENPLIFTIDKESIDERLDINYYKPLYKYIIDKITNSGFEVKTLKDVCSLSKERWEKPISGTFRYIEISDIDTFSAQIVQSKLLEVQDAPDRAQMFVRKDDIIISSTRPYRGALAIVNEEYDQCVCSTGFVIIRKIKPEVKRKYLLYYLHSCFGLKQMEQRMTGGNYPAITSDELLEIKVPVPSDGIQSTIIRIIDEALEQKETAFKESKKVSESIDLYLSEQLAIDLPKSESISPIVFKAKSCLLANQRWDVEYWKPEYANMENAINNGMYKPVLFEELIAQIINGLDYRDFTDDGLKYLRVGNIKPFEINGSDIKHIPLKLNEVSKDILLNEGDILLTRKGTFGVAVQITHNEDSYIISSEIFRIRLKNLETNAFYIVSLLNSYLGKSQFHRNSVGAIMGSLSQDAVKSIQIPLPPRDKRNDISSEIRSRIETITELEGNAREILQEAKREVVRIIAGEVLYESGL